MPDPFLIAKDVKLQLGKKVFPPTKQNIYRTRNDEYSFKIFKGL